MDSSDKESLFDRILISSEKEGSSEKFLALSNEAVFSESDVSSFYLSNLTHYAWSESFSSLLEASEKKEKKTLKTLDGFFGGKKFCINSSCLSFSGSEKSELRKKQNIKRRLSLMGKRKSLRVLFFYLNQISLFSPRLFLNYDPEKNFHEEMLFSSCVLELVLSHLSIEERFLREEFPKKILGDFEGFIKSLSLEDQVFSEVNLKEKIEKSFSKELKRSFKGYIFWGCARNFIFSQFGKHLKKKLEEKALNRSYLAHFFCYLGREDHVFSQLKKFNFVDSFFLFSEDENLLELSVISSRFFLFTSLLNWAGNKVLQKDSNSLFLLDYLVLYEPDRRLSFYSLEFLLKLPPSEFMRAFLSSYFPFVGSFFESFSQDDEERLKESFWRLFIRYGVNSSTLLAD